MYDPPVCIWAIVIAGVAAAACAVLYGGAVRAGLGRNRAALLARGRCRHPRRLAGGQRGDRGQRLVPPGARPRTVAAGRGGRLPGHVAGAEPDPGGGARPDGVPLLFTLHLTSVSALVRAPRTPLAATAPLTAAAR
jgi:hypothetical protein